MVTIQHASAYADDPQRAAEALAEICKGRVEAFHPLPGAFVCLFGRSWDGPLLELYPRTSRLVSRDGEVAFAKLKARATGAGTHFNLKVDRKRTEIESICKQRGITCSWRDWAGFLDVWLEDDLLIECDCENDR